MQINTDSYRSSNAHLPEIWVQDLDSSSEGSRVLDDASLVASTPGRLAVTDGPLAVPGKRASRVNPALVRRATQAR